MKKKIYAFFTLFFFGLFFILFSIDCEATEFRFGPDLDGELVVVIDPGHGGENLGADWEGVVEKEINMVVANATYEHLSKFEGITIYMTRTEDVDLSLLERAQFADSVNADFLFCLHFNMSELHTLYGAEVWIQSTGIENQEGYRFGSIWLSDMQDMGLYLRGIKTRLNAKGTDYYGILRHCKEFGISAALIEHAHLDHLADVGFTDSREDLERLGILDAEAVAKFFGLASDELGVDYSDYPLKELEPGKQYVPVDSTEPDMCYAKVESCDYETGEVSISLMSYDIDTPMLYYQYSLDGGNTFSPLISWPQVDMLEETSPDHFVFHLTIEQETSPKIVVRAHNKYNVTKDSNLLDEFLVFPTRSQKVEESVTADMPSDDAALEVDSAIQGSEQKQDFQSILMRDKTPWIGFMLVILALAVVLLLSLSITKLISASRRKSRKGKGPRNTRQ